MHKALIAMTDTAIKVEKLSKQYQVGVRQHGYKTLHEIIMRKIGTYTKL